MTRITIPTSLDEAVNTLGGVDALLTAKEWERAAIVAAFVSTSDGPGKRNVSSAISPVEFAALGLKGLSSANTVRHYVEAWKSTGLPQPRPGEKVDTPTSEFPSRKTKAQDVAGQPGAVAKALEDPRFAEKVAQRATPTAKQAVARTMIDDQALDDVYVKQKVRHAVVTHDAASESVSDAIHGSFNSTTLGQTFNAVTPDKDLDRAMKHLRSYQQRMESEALIPSLMDRVEFNRIVEIVATLAPYLPPVTEKEHSK